LVQAFLKKWWVESDFTKKSLSFQALQGKLKDMYNIEKMLAVRNKCLAQFSQAWNIYKGVLY
jgi:hypothetical protein